MAIPVRQWRLEFRVIQHQQQKIQNSILFLTYIGQNSGNNTKEMKSDIGIQPQPYI